MVDKKDEKVTKAGAPKKDDDADEVKLNSKGLVPVKGPDPTQQSSILLAEQPKPAAFVMPRPTPTTTEDLTPPGWDKKVHGEWPTSCPTCGSNVAAVKDPGGMGVPAGVVGWACTNTSCKNATGNVYLGDDDPRKLATDEDLDDLPEAVQIALPAMGLRREHVLDYKLTDDGVSIVTRGGKKLRWPEDASRAHLMTETEKDGKSREPERPPLYHLTGGAGVAAAGGKKR